MFLADHKRYPNIEEGLEAIRKYIRYDRIPRDPWGNPYIYRVPGPDGLDYVIICIGPDNIEGTEDDISTAEYDIGGTEVEDNTDHPGFCYENTHFPFTLPFIAIFVLFCCSLFVLVSSTAAYFAYKGYLHARKKKEEKGGDSGI
jgi:hypothetical protein